MRPLPNTCLILLLCLAGLTNCQHDEAGRAPDQVRREEHTIGASTAYGSSTPREEAEADLAAHIDFAQGIERGDLPDFKPGDSISVYINKKKHRFANVHQFRINIRQRWDSLKADGAKLDFDTTARPFRKKN